MTRNRSQARIKASKISFSEHQDKVEKLDPITQSISSRLNVIMVQSDGIMSP
jgi:hypothetical protein